MKTFSMNNSTLLLIFLLFQKNFFQKMKKDGLRMKVLVILLAQ